jgi:hypothetical protein
MHLLLKKQLPDLLLKAGNNYWKRNNYCKAISILKRLSFWWANGEDRHPVKFLAGRENLENLMRP